MKKLIVISGLTLFSYTVMLILMDIESKALLILGCVLFSIFIWYLISNKKDGPYKELWDNDSEYYEIGTRKDGEKDGPFEVIRDNGEIFIKGNYKEGIKDGLYETFFPSSDANNNDPQIKSQEHFKNGDWDGWWRIFYDNGNLEFECFYEDGFQEGISKMYSKDGTLTRVIIWNHGTHDIYEDIAAEIEAGLMDKSLFVQAEIEAGGDSGKVRSIYLKLRHDKILEKDPHDYGTPLSGFWDD